MHFSCLVFAAILACAYAQVVGHPDGIYYKPYKSRHHKRHPRDLNWGSKDGGFYGRLGSDYTGSAGYRHDIFSNSRGALQGAGYGSRDLLSDTSSYGGSLTWRNPPDTVRAKLDVNQEIGGRAGASLTAEKAWKLGQDSYFVAGAGVGKTEGQQAEGKIYAGLKTEW